MRDLILDYLQDMEDLREAEEIMKNRDPAKAVSLEEMVARYGMEDFRSGHQG